MITTPLYRMYDKVNKRYREGSYYLSKSWERFVWRCGGRDKIPTWEDYVIERCTWIQDKHKNWIYEGDIYKVDWTTFSKDWIEIEPTVNNIIEFIADFTDRDFWYSEERIEVVWNIHN